MKLQRSVLLVLVTAAVAARAAAGVTGYRQTTGGLVADVDGGRLTLTVCSERAVRVLFTANDSPALAPSLAVVHPCEGSGAVALRETKTALELTTPKLEVHLDRASGAVSFHDATGRTLLSETAGGAR